MLLCTPLTSREIIGGQVLALRRSFLWPVVVLLVLLFVPAMVHFFAVRAWSSPELGTAAFALGTGGIYCLRMVADCYALGAFGMWLALTAKKPGLAPALAILFVLILPSALCWLDIIADVFISWGGETAADGSRAILAREYQPGWQGAACRQPCQISHYRMPRAGKHHSSALAEPLTDQAGG
jgi:hypothetical protein